MKPDVRGNLLKLRTLCVSGHFKDAVLADVLTIQAEQIRALKRGRGTVLGLALGRAGRRTLELAPGGFAPLPAHAKPLVEAYYQFGGAEA